jgi:hypothetical protein
MELTEKYQGFQASVSILRHIFFNHFSPSHLMISNESLQQVLAATSQGSKKTRPEWSPNLKEGTPGSKIPNHNERDRFPGTVGSFCVYRA